MLISNLEYLEISPDNTKFIEGGRFLGGLFSKECHRAKKHIKKLDAAAMDAYNKGDIQTGDVFARESTIIEYYAHEDGCKHV
ncbi:MAG: hypothetical protein F6K26_09505 [Moorea sp. SIO2I5]|nr:hypothetical protein [Moorena sp. SIO2I5]